MSKQRDKHCVDPISPELVERINDAARRWGGGEGDCYRQITEAYSPAQLDDAAFPGPLSAELASLEDEFTSILETVPRTNRLSPLLHEIPQRGEFAALHNQFLPTLSRTEMPRVVVKFALWGLMATASCRREIEAERTAAAAWEMFVASQLSCSISMIVSNSLEAPTLNAGLRGLARSRRGRETKRKNARDKIMTRAGDWRRLHHQGWSDPKIWEWIAKEDDISVGQARKSTKTELKKQGQRASRPPTDP